jgi:NDP-sugar pyrophosphorylase family protein
MIAVIIVPGPNPEMLGLDQHTSVSLLPLVDRPILQHLIEFLLLEGIGCFELLIEHEAERVKAYLGNGARWGCSIRYHLVANPGRLYEALGRLPQLRLAPWFLVHLNHFPYTSLAWYANEAHPIFFCRATNAESKRWVGTAYMPSGFDSGELAWLSKLEFSDYWVRLEQAGRARSIIAAASVSTETPAALLDAQRQVLDRRLDRLLINGVERQPGIWLSRKAALHASVRLSSPVYIGANARIERGVSLGPHAVIGANSIIDAHTSVRNSLVTGETYVGQGLELDGVIADRNLLVHSRLETELVVKEDFLLGGL